MADTDPPNEVDDGESPADRDVYPPDANALIKEPAHRKQKPLQDQEANRHPEQPAVGDGPAQHDRGDLVGDTGKGLPR